MRAHRVAAAGAVLSAMAMLCAGDALAQRKAKGKGKAEAAAPYRNVTAGGPLRPGVYGRIEVRGAEPPPLIFKEPVIGSGALKPSRPQPLYLYVPPGQVRRWKDHCAKWSACERAVLFVRMEQSPSQWGAWRHLRNEDVALHGSERPE